MYRHKQARSCVTLVGATLVLLSNTAAAQRDPTALGGVQGVVAAQDEAGLGSRSAIMTRSAQVVPALRPVQQPIIAAAQPAGELRLWMEGFPDMRVPVGTVGRLNATASRPGFLMLWTMGATGAVFSIADGITPGRGIIELAPDRTATLPTEQGFEIAICPPAGQALWFALHSDTVIPAAARDRLARELSGARIEEAEGAARFHGIVARVIAETPGWAARSHTMVYEVLPGPADSRCAPVPDATPAAAPPPAPPAPVAPPVPTPPVQVAPPAAPQPALPWLVPGARPIEVRLSATSYRAQDMMRVEVRAPVACPSLTVVALGAGGAVDVLLPNSSPATQVPAPMEIIRVPGSGTGLELRVRTPPAPGSLERVVALCDTAASQPIFQRRAEHDGPTSTLRPGDEDFLAFTRQVENANQRGQLLVGLASYTNLGGGR